AGRAPGPGGCRSVRDSTLVGWYLSLYAPRTGGAYDSHHRTAGIAGCTRRRGSGVAVWGARAAAGKTGDWIPRAQIVRRRCPADLAACISPGPESLSENIRRDYKVFGA